MATNREWSPAGTVAMTVFVAVSMTETELPSSLATYAREPLGVIATPQGADPTGMVAVTESAHAGALVNATAAQVIITARARESPTRVAGASRRRRLEASMRCASVVASSRCRVGRATPNLDADSDGAP